MTGNFDVGGFNISNVNLVDGIDIAAHAANANTITMNNTVMTAR